MAEIRSILNDSEYGRREAFYRTGEFKKYGNIALRHVKDPATSTSVVFVMKRSHTDDFPNSYLRFIGEDIDEMIHILTVTNMFSFLL